MKRNRMEREERWIATVREKLRGADESLPEGGWEALERDWKETMDEWRAEHEAGLEELREGAALTRGRLRAWASRPSLPAKRAISGPSRRRAWGV